MHKRMLLWCAFLVLATIPSLGLTDPSPDEVGGWSWRGGFFGTGLDRSRVFDNDTFYPGYLCDVCRDPAEYPMDYVAVAYNGMFGEDPWMRGSQLGTPFRIYNLEGKWVVVWFEGIVFDVNTLLPDTMDVRLRLPNGLILTFSVLQGGPDLPIGDPNSEPADPNSCHCGTGDDEGDEGEDDSDLEDEPPEHPEEPGHAGVVEIVDPDEDGYFPDWEL